jgi:hypothetical protein
MWEYFRIEQFQEMWNVNSIQYSLRECDMSEYNIL